MSTLQGVRKKGIGLLLAGRVMDKLGARRGFALAVLLWSLAAIGHAAADGFPGLKLPTLNLDASTGFSVVLLAGAADLLFDVAKI